MTLNVFGARRVVLLPVETQRLVVSDVVQVDEILDAERDGERGARRDHRQYRPARA